MLIVFILNKKNKVLELLKIVRTFGRKYRERIENRKNARDGITNTNNWYDHLYFYNISRNWNLMQTQLRIYHFFEFAQ